MKDEAWRAWLASVAPKPKRKRRRRRRSRRVVIAVRLDGRGVLRRAQAELLRAAMRVANGNITRAAELLGTHRQSLQRKLRQS